MSKLLLTLTVLGVVLVALPVQSDIISPRPAPQPKPPRPQPPLPKDPEPIPDEDDNTGNGMIPGLLMSASVGLFGVWLFRRVRASGPAAPDLSPLGRGRFEPTPRTG